VTPRRYDDYLGAGDDVVPDVPVDPDEVPVSVPLFVVEPVEDGEPVLDEGLVPLDGDEDGELDGGVDEEDEVDEGVVDDGVVPAVSVLLHALNAMATTAIERTIGFMRPPVEMISTACLAG
jgi:hypothetical protein